MLTALQQHWAGLQTSAGRDAIELWHLYVHEDHVGAVGICERQCFFVVPGLRDPVAVSGKDSAEQQPGRMVVVDHQEVRTLFVMLAWQGRVWRA
jgi:hypothetical protein